MICYYLPPPRPCASNHMCVSSWNCPLNSPLAAWQRGQVDSRLELGAVPVQVADQLCHLRQVTPSACSLSRPLCVGCDPSERLCPVWCSARGGSSPWRAVAVSVWHHSWAKQLRSPCWCGSINHTWSFSVCLFCKLCLNREQLHENIVLYGWLVGITTKGTGMKWQQLVLARHLSSHSLVKGVC